MLTWATLAVCGGSVLCFAGAWVGGATSDLALALLVTDAMAIWSVLPAGRAFWEKAGARVAIPDGWRRLETDAASEKLRELYSDYKRVGS